MKEASLQTRKAFLKDLCFQVVDKFVLREDKMNQLISKLEKEKEADVGMLPNGRFPCRYPSCKKSFARDGKAREDHEKIHGLQRDHLTTAIEITQRDDQGRRNWGGRRGSRPVAVYQEGKGGKGALSI